MKIILERTRRWGIKLFPFSRSPPKKTNKTEKYWSKDLLESFNKAMDFYVFLPSKVVTITKAFLSLDFNLVGLMTVFLIYRHHYHHQSWYQRGPEGSAILLLYTSTDIVICFINCMSHKMDLSCKAVKQWLRLVPLTQKEPRTLPLSIYATFSKLFNLLNSYKITCTSLGLLWRLIAYKTGSTEPEAILQHQPMSYNSILTLFPWRSCRSYRWGAIQHQSFHGF